jgi:hypothetical protein
MKSLGVTVRVMSIKQDVRQTSHRKPNDKKRKQWGPRNGTIPAFATIYWLTVMLNSSQFWVINWNGDERKWLSAALTYYPSIFLGENGKKDTETSNRTVYHWARIWTTRSRVKTQEYLAFTGCSFAWTGCIKETDWRGCLFIIIWSTYFPSEQSMSVWTWLCSGMLCHVDWCAYCFHHIPDDGGNKNHRNIGKFPPD